MQATTDWAQRMIHCRTGSLEIHEGSCNVHAYPIASFNWHTFGGEQALAIGIKLCPKCCLLRVPPAFALFAEGAAGYRASYGGYPSPQTA